MPELKLVKYCLLGFSVSQIMGMLVSGWSFHEPILFVLITCLILLIPGILHYAGTQNNAFLPINQAVLFSCFVPSFVAIAIVLIGFFLGIYVN